MSEAASASGSEIGASAILVTGDKPEALTAFLSRLRSQTVADKLEVIVVAHPKHVDNISALRPNEFQSFQAVTGDLSTSARGRAEGVRHASKDRVIFCEDHAFPLSDDWAERMLARMDEGYTAVGPVMRNANPDTSLSWATLFIEYAYWLGTHAAGPTNQVAGHNSAYRRDALLELGERLPDLLEAEWVLQKELAAKGHRFYTDPMVETAHLNYSRLAPSLRLHVLAGRAFAATRSQNWPLYKRAAFAAASPAIAVKRFLHSALHAAQSPGTRAALLGASPYLALFCGLGAVGEAIGYLFGSGPSASDLAEMEYCRWRNVRREEAETQMAPIY
ncbi:glycosyltransferase [Ovoidimarina sediminis]|uniref:glycosyltransferase n=1 Tax=Ovoidimarina sediminis TaxID=3079856 RepID=UPI00291348A9|nr:glycosyltransferase [Rhodophyticola sp. MJ-SS7]MDU8942187.1 glycosyltransferase [Rhodophyticola sp. MJ-SS7]